MCVCGVVWRVVCGVCVRVPHYVVHITIHLLKSDQFIIINCLPYAAAMSELNVALFRAKIAQHNTASLGFFHKLGFAEVQVYNNTSLVVHHVWMHPCVCMRVCVDCFLFLQASRSEVFKEVTFEFSSSSPEADRMRKATEGAHWVRYT